MSEPFSSTVIDYLQSPPNPNPEKNIAEVKRLLAKLKSKLHCFVGLKSCKQTVKFIHYELAELGSTNIDTNYWVTAAVLETIELNAVLAKAIHETKCGIKYLIDTHAFTTQPCSSLAYEIHIVYVTIPNDDGPPTNKMDVYHEYMRSSGKALRTLLIIEFKGDRTMQKWPVWVSILRSRKVGPSGGIIIEENPKRLPVGAASTQVLKFFLSDLAAPSHLRYYHSCLDAKKPIRLSLGIIFNRIQSIRGAFMVNHLAKLVSMRRKFDRNATAAVVEDTANDTLKNLPDAERVDSTDQPENT